MEKIMVEIRVGEGGEDAKLLIADMKDIYIRAAKANNFNYEIREERNGFTSIYL